MTLTDAEDLDIISMGSLRFTGKDYGHNFDRPAAAHGGSEPIVFRVTAKVIELLLYSGSEVMISVDGGEPFHAGSMSILADCGPIVVSDAPAEHTVSITPIDDSEATLLAVAYN